MNVILVILRRIFAIAGKELRDVWRQPRLVLALVVGPFLILLIFGTGYQSIPPPLATILVVEEDSGLSGAVEELQESLEPAVEIVVGSHPSSRRVLLRSNSKCSPANSTIQG